MKSKRYSQKSEELVARYLNGDKKITIRDIEHQERIDRFNYLFDCWSFNKNYLKPIVFLPLVIYFIFLD